MSFCWHDLSEHSIFRENDIEAALSEIDLLNGFIQIKNPILGFGIILLLLSKNISIDIENLKDESVIFKFDQIPKLANQNQINLSKLRIDLMQSGSSALIHLRTSGTTGKPKVSSQSFSSFLRGLKIRPNHQGKKWLLSYLPFHTAGLQVFFQAFFSNSELFFLPLQMPQLILETLQENKISNLSFTPSFFKSCIPHFKGNHFYDVETVSFGGEALTENLQKHAASIFPKATIRSIYALTETGSLMASKNGLFKIPEGFQHLIKISSEDIILVHNSLVGSNSNLSDWYNTGDRVERVSKDEFKIVGRISDFINVGGYKVNPQKVESVIQTVPGVQSVTVKSKNNSVLGTIVIAEIIPNGLVNEIESLKQSILDTCKQQLARQEIPIQFKFVNKFELSSSGKIIRNENR